MKRKEGDWRNGPWAVKLPRSEFLRHWCDENEVIWQWIDPWVTAILSQTQRWGCKKEQSLPTRKGQ